MDKICAYCNHHAWSDHLLKHICLTDSKPRECSDSCDKFAKSRRGYVVNNKNA